MNKQELEHWVEILDNAFLDGDMYNARSIAMMLADEVYYVIERGQSNHADATDCAAYPCDSCEHKNICIDSEVK